MRKRSAPSRGGSIRIAQFNTSGTTTIGAGTPFLDGAVWNNAGTLDITTGLKGLWQFDANPNDASGNGYNGTLTGGASIDTTAATNKIGAGKLSLDGINDYVVHGRTDAVNPAGVGTKAAAHYVVELPAGGQVVLRLRLSAEAESPGQAFGHDDDVVPAQIGR